MSISTELERIINAKESIKAVINSKGGSITTETIDKYPAAIESLSTGDSAGGSSGSSMGVYKVLNCDPGAAYEPYQNVRLSGITAPADLVGDYIVTKVTDTGTTRQFVKGDYQLAYSHDENAWCFYEAAAGKPYSATSLLYAKLEGLSSGKGDSYNPMHWDSADVISADSRMLTRDFEWLNAPYGQYDSMWCIFVKLKAGTAYTIGVPIPTDDGNYSPYIDLYKYTGSNWLDGSSLAYANQVVAEAVEVAGKSVNCYLTYTPTEDGLYVIAFKEQWSDGITAPMACSPAPEETLPPKTGLFEQDGNWKVGGGAHSSFEITSCGTAACIQKYTQIEGNGVDFDSVWQSADGEWHVYWYMSDTNQKVGKWMLAQEKGTHIHYHFHTTDIWTTETPILPHPAECAWTGRASSSYGAFPVVELTPAEVTGTPALAPIDMPGREDLCYAIWDGMTMQQNADGLWVETGEKKLGMKSYTNTPIPGKVYTADGTAKVAPFAGEKDRLYWWGYTTYAAAGDGGIATANTYEPTQVTNHAWKQLARYSSCTYAIDTDGYLWAWGECSSTYQIPGYSSGTLTTPTKISDKTWKMVCAGSGFGMAIDADGYLFCWGKNSYGQLGTGNTTHQSAITQIGTDKWKYVAVGIEYTIAIDENGNMYGVGRGYNSGFGNGVASGSYVIYNTLTKLNDQQWDKVFCITQSHTYAIDADGYLWGTGSNVGNGDSTTYYTFVKVGDMRWKMVAGTSTYTLGIGMDGYRYGWGTNNIGQLGLGDGNTRYVPTRLDDRRWKCVTAYYNGSAGVDEYGQLCWWGGDSQQLTPYRCYKPTPVSNTDGITFDSVVYAGNNYIAYAIGKY